MSQINSVLFKLLLVLVFHHNNRKAKEDICGQGGGVTVLSHRVDVNE